MAKTSTELPRDIQSKLHDIADEAGERVARGDMVEIDYGISTSNLQPCICDRYSKDLGDGNFKFWNRPEPECKFKHIAPLPAPFTVHLDE